MIEHQGLGDVDREEVDVDDDEVEDQEYRIRDCSQKDLNADKESRCNFNCTSSSDLTLVDLVEE